MIPCRASLVWVVGRIALILFALVSTVTGYAQPSPERSPELPSNAPKQAVRVIKLANGNYLAAFALSSGVYAMTHNGQSWSERVTLNEREGFRSASRVSVTSLPKGGALVFWIELNKSAKVCGEKARWCRNVMSVKVGPTEIQRPTTLYHC